MSKNEIKLFSKIIELEMQIKRLRDTSSRLYKQASDIYPKPIQQPERKIAALPQYNYVRASQMHKEKKPELLPAIVGTLPVLLGNVASTKKLFEYARDSRKYNKWKEAEPERLAQEERNKHEALLKAQEQQAETQRRYDYEYQQEMMVYNQEVEKANKAILHSRLLSDQRTDLLKHVNKLENIRDEYYSLAGIHTNYRNVAAMALIKEYYELGICSALEGADGAYVLVRRELIEKHKIEQLDGISSKLDMLHNDNMALGRILQSVEGSVNTLTNTISTAVYDVMNQFSKYSNDLNSNMSMLQNSLCEQASLMNEKTDLIKKELEYSNWLDTYKTLNRNLL